MFILLSGLIYTRISGDNKMNKTIEVNIPSLQELYDSLPNECKDIRIKLYSNDDQIVSVFEAVKFYYNRILASMINECKDAIKPVVYMGLFSQDDHHQKICNWSASDNNRPVENSYNFHGQNTSRWLYAGCLLYDVENNTFSIHT